jgi:hypothetical protein
MSPVFTHFASGIGFSVSKWITKLNLDGSLAASRGGNIGSDSYVSEASCKGVYFFVASESTSTWMKLIRIQKSRGVAVSTYDDAFDFVLVALFDVEPDLNPMFFPEYSKRVHNLSIDQYPPARRSIRYR